MVVQNGNVYFTATDVFIVLVCVAGIIAIVLICIFALKAIKLVSEAKKAVAKFDKICDDIQETVDDVRPAVDKCKDSLWSINSWAGNIGGIITTVFEWAKNKLA